MTRIEREKQTVQRMIELYCRHHLKVETMPEEYQHLAEFACRRLDHCKYGENKTACKNCPTHCYASKEREQIREIMRWAGPRVILYSPKDAIVHTFYNVKHWLQSLSFRTGVIVLLCCIPAPIETLSPIVTPGRIVTLPPIHTLLPMVTGLAHS